MNDADLIYLHSALTLAKIQRGFCAPNPSVGAVIVKNNKVIATGFHKGPGSPHAEIAALKKLSAEDAAGSTIYVTLEPCCHYGRTPPCTSSIISAKINRVIYAYSDSNPVVKGNGEKALLDAGIECEKFDVPEINSFYESYSYWHKTKKPFITAKIALTLDGKIASVSGKPLLITGESLKDFTHYSRRINDAILTTATTILQDDPQLNVREEEVVAKPIYILDRNLRINSTAKIFSTAKSVTIFYSRNISDIINKIDHPNVMYVPISEAHDYLDLDEVISFIGNEGVHDLWVEAGGRFFSSLVSKLLIQIAYIYVAPKWLGKGTPAFSSDIHFDLTTYDVQWHQFGKDVVCEVRL